MKIDILTLFPEMCDTVLNESIIGRARDAGLVEINCHNIRDYSTDKHKHVDDTPYGGGTGMIMQAQPIYDAYMDLTSHGDVPYHLIYMTPQGKTLTQERVKELSKLPKEVGWVEFKHNNCEPTMVGEDISALANSATLNDRDYAYMIWGVDDNTHEIVGTKVRL